MRSAVRVGALVVLLLIVSPVVLVLGRNPALIFPMAWALAYCCFRWTFPSEKQALVAALAVLTASLAWLTRLIFYNSGMAIGLDLHAGLLATGMLWLFFAQSRAAAWALIALQVVVLITGTIGVLRFNFSALDERDYIGAAGGILTSVLSHIFALLFLAQFVLMRRKDAVAATFD